MELYELFELFVGYVIMFSLGVSTLGLLYIELKEQFNRKYEIVRKKEIKKFDEKYKERKSA